MIITRTPFRVSLCGGGSDLEAFYKKNGGCVISLTINKYMYITSHPSFDSNDTVLKYSKIEKVCSVKDIEHKIFKECLKQERIKGLEITSIADIPQGTGLGSSSSFAVGLIHNLKCHKREYVSKLELAEEACNIEINKLGKCIGKQDQYAASFGGLNYYQFNKNGKVDVVPIMMNKLSLDKLENNLIMLYIGGEHDASKILEEQSNNMSNVDKENIQKEIRDLTIKLRYELEHNNVDYVGEVLDKNWQLKKQLASGISNKEFDKLYDMAIKSGATGGKILGAGGSGFFLFYVPLNKQDNFRKKMSKYRELKFKFDFLGSTVIFVG